MHLYFAAKRIHTALENVDYVDYLSYNNKMLVFGCFILNAKLGLMLVDILKAKPVNPQNICPIFVFWLYKLISKLSNGAFKPSKARIGIFSSLEFVYEKPTPPTATMNASVEVAG